MAFDPKVAIKLLGQAEEALKAVKKVRDEIKGLTGEEKKSEDAAKKSAAAAEARQQKVTASYLKTALAIGVVTVALRTLWRAVSTVGSEVELAQLTFQSFTGSAKLAKERYEELLQFAASTPLQIGEIVRGVQVLQAFGLASMEDAKAMDDLKHKMLLFGLAAKVTNLPGGAEQVIRAMADLKAGVMEIRQLSALGLSREFLRQEGVKFGKGGELVSPGTEAFEGAMRILERRYGILLEHVEDALSTKLSNLADKLFIIIKNVTEPLMGGLKGGVGEVVDFLTRVGVVAEKSGGAIATTLGAALAFVWPLWLPLVAGMKSFLYLAENAPGVLQAVTIALTAVTVAMTANRAAALLLKMTWMTNLLKPLALVKDEFLVLSAGGQAMGFALKTTALAGVTALGKGLLSLATSFGGVIVIIGAVAYALKWFTDNAVRKATEGMKKMREEMEEMHAEARKGVEELMILSGQMKSLPPMLSVTAAEAKGLTEELRQLIIAHPRAATAAGLQATATGVLDQALGRETERTYENAAAMGRLEEAMRKVPALELRDRMKVLKEEAEKLQDAADNASSASHDLAGNVADSGLAAATAAAGWKEYKKAVEEATAAAFEYNKWAQGQYLEKAARAQKQKGALDFTSPSVAAGFDKLTEEMQQGILAIDAAVREAAPGARMRITSTVRSPAQNAAVGGAPRSRHLTGRATDIGASTVYALADELGGLAAAMKYLEDTAKEADLHLLWEGGFATTAKRMGYSAKAGGAAHLHAEVLSPAEQRAYQATEAGLDYREKMNKEQAQAAEKLAKERMTAVRDEFNDAKKRLELQSEMLSVNLDEEQKLSEKAALAENLLALTKDYTEKGLTDQLDVMEAEVKAHEAQRDLQDFIVKKQQEALDRFWENQRELWDLAREREAAAFAAEQAARQQQEERAQHAAGFADRMWEIMNPAATKEERLQHERERILADQERVGARRGELEAEIQDKSIGQGFLYGGFFADVLDQLRTELDDLDAQYAGLTEDLSANTEKLKQEAKSFSRALRAALMEGIMEVGRSVASGDINQALTQLFNTLAEIIAQKVVAMSGAGGIQGALIGAGVLAVVGLIGKSLGLGKSHGEVAKVEVMNRYLNMRLDPESSSWALPPQAWYRGEVRIDMGGMAFNANFGGASADEAARDLARQVNRSVRRSLTPAMGGA